MSSKPVVPSGKPKPFSCLKVKNLQTTESVPATQKSKYYDAEFGQFQQVSQYAVFKVST